MSDNIHNELEAQLRESAVLHLERADGLLRLLRPEAEELIAALLSGRPARLLHRDGGEQSGLVVYADQDPLELERTLFSLSEAERRDWSLKGSRGLCLAPGRLLGGDGVAAPAAFLPVNLTRSESGWHISTDGEGLRLNLPLLAKLDPATAAADWSRQYPELMEQVRALLPDRFGWSEAGGLWLVRLPLWMLDLPRQEPPELPAVPELPLLDEGDATDEEGILTPLTLDGRQMTALRRLRAGGSLRAHGGRGTGKTQLSAALVANGMGERQRILYVSAFRSDRQALLERMRFLGLGRLCLDLSVEGDRTAAVLRQFNRSAQLRPATTSEDYFPLAAAERKQGQALNSAAGMLHRKGRSGHSLFELICAYLDDRDTEGHLPIPDMKGVELTGEGLDERLTLAQQLCDTAAKLGHPGTHPLCMVRGTSVEQERIDALPDVAERLTLAVTELDESVEQWVSRTELRPPVSRSDWARLRQAGSLLLEWREIPKQWRACPRIPLLSDMMAELKQRTELVEDLYIHIEQAWGERVLSINAPKLEKQWQYYQSGWKMPTQSDAESLLRRRLAEAESLLTELEQVGAQWAKAVETEMPGSRESWERSYEIAAELARWKEIPSQWGDCDNLDGLLWDVGRLIDVGRQARESKQVLLRDWDEAILQLDGAALLAKWSKEGGTWGLGWLKRQSELREELEPLCKLKLNSDVLESGIRWLAGYQQELAKCDEIYHRWQRELEPVYRKEDTVWIWLETAQRVAGESKNWLAELTGSGDFLRRYGSSETAVAAASALQTQWEHARDVLGRLDVMLQRNALLPGGENWIAERRMDCRRLRNLLNIRNHMESLSEHPVSMSEIGPMLEALSVYQREESALDVLYGRWEAELEGLYEGADTDWDTLIPAARRAVESDDKITRLTGDLKLRCKLADDEEALLAAETMVNAFDRVAEAEEEIQTAFDARLSEEDGAWLDQLRRNTELLVANRDELPVWVRWNGLCSHAERLGMRAFCACFDQDEMEGRDLPRLFRKSVYRWALSQELKREQTPFSSRSFNELLKRYIQTQRQFTQRTREELLHLGASYAANALRDEGNQEEVALLRQANRTSGVDTCPEELMRRLRALTGQMFSCVVAAPWDALRAFGGGEEPVFDYLIVEHAEQLPAWLGRWMLSLGSTALLLSDAPRAMEFEDPCGGESLWDACGAWPTLEMDLCYLPRQESLHWVDRTAFGTRLLPTARPDAFLMACKTVVGRLEQEANQPEAEAVVSAAVELVRSGQQDVGIVAMTWAQKRVLLGLLEQAAQDQPELAEGLSAVAVSTPEETLSGHCELLLLSLTLAPDRRESLSTALRLAGQWEMWRSLSDAIAAARGGVWVFCSLDRGDWDQFTGPSRPLCDFLHYLDAQTPETRTYPMQSRVQQEVCDALHRAGYEATPGPGAVSVQVARRDEPARPVLGILLDDPGYSAIPRPEEREVSRTQLLQERGWQLCRVWAMDWWRSQREVLDGLVQLLEHLPATRRGQRQSGAEETPRTRPVPLYEPADPPVIGIRPGELSSPAFRQRITRIVDEILQQEAPMAERQLTTRLLELFHLDPAEEELREVCAQLWNVLGLRVTQEGALRYIWMSNQDPDRWRGYRRSGRGANYRAPEDVSAQESANAACAVLERDSALTPLSLARATAAELGYDAGDEAAMECGRRGVEHALFLGRLMETTIGSLMPGVRK